MKEPAAVVFSNQEGIAARICPRGQIHLQIGYTSLTLPKNTFLALARIVRAVETQLAVSVSQWNGEHSH